MIIKNEKNPWFWDKNPFPTHTTIYLVPILPTEEVLLRKAGFINGYLSVEDEEESRIDENIVYLLFKIEHIEALNRVLFSFKNWIVGEWDEDKYVVIIVKFPEKYTRDINYFLKGHYTKFTDVIRKHYPKYSSIVSKVNNELIQVPSYQHQVINKGDYLKMAIEERLGILVDDYPEIFKEYCTPPDKEQETLKIKTFRQKINEKEGQQ